MTERRAMCKGFRGFLFKGNFLLWDFWTTPPSSIKDDHLKNESRFFGNIIYVLYMYVHSSIFVEFVCLLFLFVYLCSVHAQLICDAWMSMIFFLFVSMFVCLSVSLNLCVVWCISMCLFSFYLYMTANVCLNACSCLFVCLSLDSQVLVCRSICRPTSTCLSVCL